MHLIPWSPFSSVLDDYFGEGTGRSLGNVAFSPAIDVYEDGDNIIAETPLAGIDPKNVTVEIEDNVLKISGEAKHETEVDDKSYYRREVRTGAFYRAVALPKAVSGDKATANFDKGMLKISIPKAEEAKPKKITIQTN